MPCRAGEARMDVRHEARPTRLDSCGKREPSSVSSTSPPRLTATAEKVPGVDADAQRIAAIAGDLDGYRRLTAARLSATGLSHEAAGDAGSSTMLATACGVSPVARASSALDKFHPAGAHAG